MTISSPSLIFPGTGCTRITKKFLVVGFSTPVPGFWLLIITLLSELGYRRFVREYTEVDIRWVPWTRFDTEGEGTGTPY